MYASIKRLCVTAVSIRPFLSYDGMGDKDYGVDIPAMCSINETVKKKISIEGVDVISTTCLYVDSNYAIKKVDAIVLNAIEYTIHSVECFYRNGIIDLQVVYI